MLNCDTYRLIKIYFPTDYNSYLDIKEKILNEYETINIDFKKLERIYKLQTKVFYEHIEKPLLVTVDGKDYQAHRLVHKLDENGDIEYKIEDVYADTKKVPYTVDGQPLYDMEGNLLFTEEFDTSSEQILINNPFKDYIYESSYGKKDYVNKITASPFGKHVPEINAVEFNYIDVSIEKLPFRMKTPVFTHKALTFIDEVRVEDPQQKEFTEVPVAYIKFHQSVDQDTLSNVFSFLRLNGLEPEEVLARNIVINNRYLIPQDYIKDLDDAMYNYIQENYFKCEYISTEAFKDELCNLIFNNSVYSQEKLINICKNNIDNRFNNPNFYDESVINCIINDIVYGEIIQPCNKLI